LYTEDTNPAMPTSIPQQKQFSGSLDEGNFGYVLRSTPVQSFSQRRSSRRLDRLQKASPSSGPERHYIPSGDTCGSLHNFRSTSESTTCRFKIPAIIHRYYPLSCKSDLLSQLFYTNSNVPMVRESIGEHIAIVLILSAELASL